MSYAEEVGARLRRIRVQQGWSLQDVERRSDGAWKAAVVGSYERGDRNISAARLIELADFYGVGPSDVLPPDGRPAPTERSAGVVIDLRRLTEEGDRFDGVRRYCESVQQQRGDYNRDQLSLRGEDLRALGVIMGRDPQDLVGALRDSGVLRQAG